MTGSTILNHMHTQIHACLIVKSTQFILIVNWGWNVKNSKRPKVTVSATCKERAALSGLWWIIKYIFDMHDAK
jgi:hypothetical protein